MGERFSDSQMLKLVEIYREYECLWNVTSALYKNHDARESAYKQIAERLNISGISFKEIPKKIKNLRSSYYQELKKIEKSRRSGCAQDSVYKPKVSWFTTADGFLKTFRNKENTFSNSEIDKTFCTETNTVEEKVVVFWTPQLQSTNEFDSSEPNYNLDIKTQAISEDAQSEDSQSDTSQDSVVGLDTNKELPSDIQSTSEDVKIFKTKRKNIHNVSASIIKRKKMRQMNEDVITTKKLEILEIQRQHELMKLERTKLLLDVDIELKRTLLENAKMDLEFKKKNFLFKISSKNNI